MQADTPEASRAFASAFMPTPRLLWTLCLILTCSPAGVFAGVENQWRQQIASSDLRNTRVAAAVMDLDTGQMLAGIHPDRRMIPASNMKLITTAAALKTFGKDFRFKTKLQQLPAGEGQSRPRLIVRGSGDPTFGDPVLLKRYGYSVDGLLKQWVEAVKQTGQKQFAGLILDDRVFDRDFVREDWPRDQLIRHYCAQVAGINFHENVLHVMPIPGDQKGQAARVQLYPPVPFMERTNRVTTGDSGIFAIDRKLGTNKLIFRGEVAKQPSDPYKLTFHDPPMVFGQVLAQSLRQNGIEPGQIDRPAQQAELAEGETLAVATTTLPLVLQRTNRESENMFAEALFKRLGRYVTGRPGSWENGSAAIRLFLRRTLGPASASVTIADGSGMSRANRVTPRLLVKLLDAMHRDQKLGSVYRKSLARAGQNGTLDDRMSNVPGAVYAKSGYLNGVSALSGYLVLPHRGEQKTLAFSLLFNGFAPPVHNHDIKRLQDALVRDLAQRYAQPANVGG
jgi:D-alanyl-D-alanine carboxypeptidase/D-alanyl-D-alanine-endopeptidase (penicillin-binding protein 4)